MDTRESIAQIKASCEAITNKLSQRYQSAYKDNDKENTSVEKYIKSMNQFNNALAENNYEKMSQACSLFIKNSAAIFKNPDAAKIFGRIHAEFSSEVSNLQKICEEEKQKLNAEHIKIIEKYQKTSKKIKEILNHEVSIENQIELLNVIKEYQKNIQSDQAKFQLDQIEANKKSINNISTEFDNYSKYLQEKIDKYLENISEQVAKNLLEFQELKTKIKLPIVRLESEILSVENVAESKAITAYKNNQARIINKLNDNLKLISTINKLNQQDLSAPNKNHIKNLQHFENDINTLINGYKDHDIFDQHNNIQKEGNNELKLILKKLIPFKEKMQNITDFSLNPPLSLLIDNPDTETKLQNNITVESKNLKFYIAHEELLDKFIKELSALNKNIGNLSDVKYSDGRSVIFSQEFKQLFGDNKKSVTEMLETCTKYKKTAVAEIKKSGNKIGALQTELYQIQNLPKLDQFEKIEGDTFNKIKNFILDNPNYQKLIKHMDNTAIDKQKDIKDFKYGIEHSLNLDQLMSLISPTYRNSFAPESITINEAKLNLFISQLDERMRKTTSSLGFFKITGNSSTTDKYLKKLEHDIIKYIKENHGLDLVTKAEEKHTLKALEKALEDFSENVPKKNIKKST